MLERGDPDRLLTVFTNVMINAFDALSAHRNGDGRLLIAARNEDDRVIVSFADNGPGMTKDELANAFEPFFTTKEPGCGTGLGLWVCYQVVEKHGGVIRVTSQTGEGVCVTVELPKQATNGQATGDRLTTSVSNFLEKSRKTDRRGSARARGRRRRACLVGTRIREALPILISSPWSKPGSSNFRSRRDW
ncbi:MAG: HAMP domain-containing histidine kinase [Phycisphaerales bacterium]|nr:HAMP domain-containing histidine kinase [Phycisphaerales bacterium]